MRTAPLAANATVNRVALTACHTQRFVHRGDDFCHGNEIGCTGETISATRTARTLDESGTTQFREKLLKIFLTDVLAFGNCGQRYGSPARILGDIDHRHYRVPT